MKEDTETLSSQLSEAGGKSSEPSSVTLCAPLKTKVITSSGLLMSLHTHSSVHLSKTRNCKPSSGRQTAPCSFCSGKLHHEDQGRQRRSLAPEAETHSWASSSCSPQPPSLPGKLSPCRRPPSQPRYKSTTSSPVGSVSFVSILSKELCERCPSPMVATEKEINLASPESHLLREGFLASPLCLLTWAFR